MLILRRNPGEIIMIGDDIAIMPLRGHENSKAVRLGVLAPPNQQVFRDEIYMEILQQRIKEGDLGAQDVIDKINKLRIAFTNQLSKRGRY